MCSDVNEAENFFEAFFSTRKPRSKSAQIRM